MIERDGDYAYDLTLHGGEGRTSIKHYFVEEGSLPVSVQMWTLQPGASEDGCATARHGHLGRAGICRPERLHHRPAREGSPRGRDVLVRKREQGRPAPRGQLPHHRPRRPSLRVAPATGRLRVRRDPARRVPPNTHAACRGPEEARVIARSGMLSRVLHSLAADSVAVAVEVRGVTGVAHVHGSRPGLTRRGAVLEGDAPGSRGPGGPTGL